MMTNIVRILKSRFPLLSLVLALGAAQPLLAGVTFTISPNSVSNTYIGPVTLQISGLATGETVVVQKFFDINGNGLIDTGEWLGQEFTLTDGQAGMVIGGVTNFNVPGDNNPTNGVITAKAGFPNGDFSQQVVGKYLFRLSSPSASFTPITNSFSVTAYPFGQSFAGTVLSNGTSTVVPNAVVLLFPAGGNGSPVAGAMANSAGAFNIPVAPGSYSAIGIKRGYFFNLGSAPSYVVGSGVDISNNVAITNANSTISGTVLDSANSTATLPGIFITAQTQTGLVAVDFSDANGNYTVGVSSKISSWGIKAQDTSLQIHGYLAPQNKTSATPGQTGVALAVPKATALVYGNVLDNLGNPVPGVDIYANDDNSQYETDGFSNPSGSYVMGAIGGLAGDLWQIEESSDNGSTGYLFTQPSFDQNGGATINTGEALQVNFTAIPATNTISGTLKDGNGSPLAGVGIFANATINGVYYSQNSQNTDANGNYSINVAAASWTVNVDTGSGNGNLPAGYFAPSETVVVSNANVTLNIVATQSPYTISGYLLDNNNKPIANVGVYAYANTVAGTSYNQNVTTSSTGFYSVPVNNGTWTVGINNGGGNNELPATYLDPQSQTVNIANASVTLNFTAFPTTSTISGTLTDGNGNPLAGINIYAFATINNVSYNQNTQTAANGSYSLGVVNGSWQVGISTGSGSGSLAANYLSPQNETVQISNNSPTVNLTAPLATNYITGNVKINGTNVVGVGVSAGATINNLSYNQYVDTDANGNYTLDVANGAWNVSINCYGGSDSLGNLLSGINFNCPSGQSVNIAGNNATNNFTVTVQANGGVSITTTSLPNGPVGVYYDQFLQGTTLSSLLNWSLLSGSLPPGLSLSASGSGEIYGTPANTGAFSFTVQVIDGNNSTASQVLSITVTPGPVRVTTTYLPYGTAGVFYSQNLQAIAGQPPYSWSLSPGSASLPSNLTLSTNGLLAGTPAANGTDSFSVRVTDANSATADEALTLFVGTATSTSLFNFTTNNGTITITNYLGGAGTVILPVTINGLPVTSIGTGAFLDSRLTNIIIPSSVTNIGDQAFSGANLASVTIPASVVSIGNGSFSDCTNLANLILPNGLARLGYSAFSDCSGLTNVSFPESLASLGDYAFASCDNLASIALPGGLTNLGYAAFQNCFALTNALFGYGATTIGDNSFQYCGSLTLVTIPNTVTNLGGLAFEGCTSLSSVAIPGSIASVGLGAFTDCSGLTNVTFGYGVTNISYGAFQGCSSLTSVTIPSSVISLADDAFESCVNLTGIYFEGNAPTVDSSVFVQDNSLTAYYLSGTTGWVSYFGGVPTAVWSVTGLSGSLQVTIQPPGAVSAGAQWQVDGNTAQNSGATVANLSVGNHTLSFTPISGWTTPASQTVSISPNSTATASGTFVATTQTGSLQVTLYPSAAVTAGAQWAVDGGSFTNSGATLTNLSVGNHTVTFSTISGWTAPPGVVVAVTAGATATAGGTYVAAAQTGSLQVTLTPAGAVTAGAQWAVDGGSLTSSGATIANLSVGNHTVTFSTIAGWTTPANQTVSVAANTTTTATGTYVAVPQTGSLQVTITPAAVVTAGAQWRVDGGSFANSGATVTGLSVGNHTVNFSTVSGWATPPDVTVSVTANTTATASGTYVAVPQAGSLQVTIAPAGAVTNGAKWQVDAETPQASGATVTNLSAGTHTVSFTPIAGWSTPSNQTVTVTNGETTTTTGVYVQVLPGSLKVTILPSTAAAAGAEWQVDGGKSQKSGALVTNLSAGNHSLTFNTIKGWLTPPAQTVVVTSKTTNTATGTYTALGSLQVTLAPAGAIAGGAEWQVDYNGNWLAGGVTVSNLAVGNHTLSYRGVDYWTAPPTQTVAIKQSAVTKVAGTYVFNGAGIYNGLFSEQVVSVGTAGMLSGLTVTPSGSYSGKLLIGQTTNVISGVFNYAGQATNVIKRAASQGGWLTLAFGISWNAQPVGVGGTVSGTNGGDWQSTLTAEPTNAPSPSVEYTALLLPAGTPPGYGYLLITNHSGLLTFSGALADGTAFSQSVPVSGDTELPIYGNFYGGTGLLFGWIGFQNGAPAGALTWIKESSHFNALYTNGFANTVTVRGSLWTNPPAKTAAIDLPDGQLVLSEGGLTPAGLNFNVNVSNNNALVKLGTTPTNTLTGAITAKTGLLSITFGNGAGKATTVATGAVLQDAGTAGGFFLTKTNAGSFSLAP